MKSKFTFLLLVTLQLALGSLVRADGPPPLPIPPTIPWPQDSQFPGTGPINHLDRFQKTWAGRRGRFALSKKQDHGAVVFLGDSITQGWLSLAKDFPGMKVANRGISGDMTRGVWQRLDEDVLALEPEAVVLLIGTNDLEHGGKPEEVAANIAGILKQIHTRNNKTPIIVCDIMPSSETMHRPATLIKKTNALLDAVIAGEPNCVRCDTWSLYANAQGDARPEDFKDLLHPNAAGYVKWKTALQPIFAKLKL